LDKKRKTEIKLEMSLDVEPLLKLIPTLGSTQNIFEDCKLLTADQQDILSQWLNEGKISNLSWKLVWRGSKDGVGEGKFQSLCCNKGESVCVIKSSDGYIFGGYSSSSWKDIGEGENFGEKAPGSFLFTITNPHKIPPTKYMLKDKHNAIFHQATGGPIFGDDTGDLCDIHIAPDYNSNLNFIGFPISYIDTTGQGNITFTGTETFFVGDIEVFTH
jgi:hypothetical protein